jgi:hypothetical protein
MTNEPRFAAASVSAQTREKRRRNGGVAWKKLTVNSPSQTPSMVPGLNVEEGFSGVGASPPARRLHRSHSQSHSELMWICEETEDGTVGDMDWRASAPVNRWGARLRNESTAGAVSGSGEKDGYSAYAGGNALRPSLWFGTKSTQAGRHTGYCKSAQRTEVPRPKTEKKGVCQEQNRNSLCFPKEKRGDCGRKSRDNWTDVHFSLRDPPERSARQRSDKMARGGHETKPGLRAWERAIVRQDVCMCTWMTAVARSVAPVPKFHIWHQ